MATLKEKIDSGYYKSKASRKFPFNEFLRDQTRLYEEFKQDALKQSGLHSHPKKDAIFDFVWREWHSDGLNTVYYYLGEISNLA